MLMSQNESNSEGVQICPECHGTCVEPRTVDDPCLYCYGEGFLLLTDEDRLP